MPITESDIEFFARELEDFVPARVFDAHAHLYRTAFFSGKPFASAAMFPEMGLSEFRRIIEDIVPGRKPSGLFFGFPSIENDIEANNRFVRDEVRSDPNSRAHMLVTPSMDPEWIREAVRRDGFVGLKCYHVYSSDTQTFESHIPAYLPEDQVRIAHEEGLSITLHMVRSRGMADKSNQQIIRSWAIKYPNARFILAHAARGFNPHHTIEGIGSLQGVGNIWCDSSAVSDSGAFEAVIRTLGSGRLLYGSDAPVSHFRGRSVAIGDSFLWISSSNTNFSTPYAEVSPVLLGLESLRVLKLACWNLGLTDSEVEKIFWGNAAEMFNVT
jgi:predicted TIM-barrel fold metal-dependent hydrolase